MECIKSPGGATVSYDQSGSGPSLVLVHGSFSDHHTNWQFVKPILRDQFTVCAIARRGRGKTDATERHSLEDEARDLVALIEAVQEPVLLLGNSHVPIAALPLPCLSPTAFESWCCTKQLGRVSSRTKLSHPWSSWQRPTTGRI